MEIKISLKTEIVKYFKCIDERFRSFGSVLIN